MDACNIDEIQNLFIYYSACFSKYFPELGFYCNEREFQIHGIVRRYSDITGVSHDGSPDKPGRSEERRVGKECRSRWSPYH